MWVCVMCLCMWGDVYGICVVYNRLGSCVRVYLMTYNRLWHCSSSSGVYIDTEETCTKSKQFIPTTFNGQAWVHPTLARSMSRHSVRVPWCHPSPQRIQAIKKLTVELSSYSGNFYIHAVLSFGFWHHFVDRNSWEEWQVVTGSLATVSSPVERYVKLSILHLNALVLLTQ